MSLYAKAAKNDVVLEALLTDPEVQEDLFVNGKQITTKEELRNLFLEADRQNSYEYRKLQPAYHAFVKVPNLSGMANPTAKPNVPNPMPAYYTLANVPDHGQYEPDPKEVNAIFNRGIINRTLNNFKPGPLKTFVGVCLGIGASVALYGGISMLAPNPVKNIPTRSKEWREATYERESKTRRAEFRALVELQRAIDEKHLDPKDL